MKPKEQFNKSVSQIGKDLKSIKENFGIKSFIFILLGLCLIGFNLYLYFVGLIYTIENRVLAETIVNGILGMIGTVVSVLLIFLLTIHMAADKPAGSEGSFSGSSMLSSALEDKTPKRKKKIAVAVLVYVLIFGVGIGVLTYFFVDLASHSGFVEVQATIKSLISSGDGYRSVYEFSFGGTTYTVIGHVESSGGSVPVIGDIVTILINPTNPNQLYIVNEKLFFLIFGSFFLLCGIIVVSFELVYKNLINVRIFVGIVCIGLTAVIAIVPFMNGNINSFTEFIGKNLWFCFILIFTNVGVLQFIEGLVYFKKLKNYKISKNNEELSISGYEIKDDQDYNQ